MLGFLYFYRPLFLGETLFFRDLLYDFIPQKRLLIEFFQQGEWPLWDIYRHGGQPYFADPNNSVFHPVNMLFFLFPFFRAFNLFIVLHALLSLTGVYFFSRTIKLSPISSLVASMIYGFCGYSLSLINLFGRFLAMAYLPFLFLFWHAWLQEQKRRWFLLTVVFGVLQVLSGAPEVNVISMLSLLGWTLMYGYRHVPLSRKCLTWIALGVFIIGISSIQLIPTLEMLRHSSRGSGMDYEEFSSSSLPPKRLPELFVPNFSGYIDFLPYTEHYWGVALTDGSDYPYILNIYFGCIALVLGILGGISPRGSHLLSRKLRIGLLVVFLGSIILSLGRSLPFFRSLYHSIPLMSLFRYPIKFLLAGLFPIAVLTGYATEQYFGNHTATSGKRQKRSKPLFTGLWTLTAGFCGITFLLVFSHDFANRFHEFFFQQQDGEIMIQSVRQSLLHASVMLFVFTLLLHYRYLTPRNWQSWGVAFLVAADLLSAGVRINITAPTDFFTDRPPSVQTVEQHIRKGRLFRTENPEDIQLYAPSNEVVWGYRWNLETLNNYLGAFYHIPVLFHDDYVGLGNKRLMQLKSAVKLLPWRQKRPLLSASGVTTILTSERLDTEGIQYVTTIPNRSDAEFHLYQNTQALPRIAFITNLKIVHSDDEALQAMLAPDYDPLQHVVLQAIDKIPLSQGQATGEHTSCPSARFVIHHRTNSLQEFSVSTQCSGYLVFSEPFYPGWTARIDGKNAEIIPANLAFSAIFLSAGEHTLVRSYQPKSLLAGMLSSLIFCGLLGTFCWRVQREDKR